jgi:FixJ family two-component response regulator
MFVKPLISIVDDDESVRATTMDLVSSMGFAAEVFSQPVDFLKSGDLSHTSCLIADMRMPGMTGLELHSRLVESGHAIPTILITAFPDDRDRARARQSGVRYYLAKPFQDKELLDCIRRAIGSIEAN